MKFLNKSNEMKIYINITRKDKSEEKFVLYLTAGSKGGRVGAQWKKVGRQLE